MPGVLGLPFQTKAARWLVHPYCSYHQGSHPRPLFGLAYRSRLLSRPLPLQRFSFLLVGLADRGADAHRNRSTAIWYCSSARSRACFSSANAPCSSATCRRRAADSHSDTAPQRSAAVLAWLCVKQDQRRPSGCEALWRRLLPTPRLGLVASCQKVLTLGSTVVCASSSLVFGVVTVFRL